MASAAIGSHPAGIPNTWRAFSGSNPAIWWTANPRAVASTESRADAAPVSYCALRLGALFFANASCATAIASTGALLAQLALNSTRTLSIFSKLSLSSLVATIYAQGCSLLLEGAQRAASKMLRRTFCGTGLSAKARGLQRSRISSWTGKSVGAGFCMSSIPSICDLLFDGAGGVDGAFAPSTAFPNRADSVLSVTGFSGCLPDHFRVDGDIDVITDDHAAVVQSGVPLHAEVLAVDLGCGCCGCSHIAPGIFHGSRRPFNVEDDFLGGAANGEITGDLELSGSDLLDFLGFESHGREVRDVKEFVAAQVVVAIRFARIHG